MHASSYAKAASWHGHGFRTHLKMSGSVGLRTLRVGKQERLVITHLPDHVKRLQMVCFLLPTEAHQYVCGEPDLHTTPDNMSEP
jgi:hypothetical protein